MENGRKNGWLGRFTVQQKLKEYCKSTIIKNTHFTKPGKKKKKGAPPGGRRAIKEGFLEEVVCEPHQEERHGRQMEQAGGRGTARS